MQTYVRFPALYSSETHEQRLVFIKENLNALGDLVQEIHKNRAEVKQWQAELVNRLLPRLDVLTTEIDNAIRYIDENPDGDYRPVYVDHIDTAYNKADAVAETVDRYLEWADAVREKRKISQAAIQ